MPNDIETIIEIPAEERVKFQARIVDYRKKYIRGSEKLVEEVFSENPLYRNRLVAKEASSVILEAREGVWQKFLIEEAEFNALLLKDLSKILETPNRILEELLEAKIANKTGDDLRNAIKETCGEYAGRIAPYVYCLSLSNTQSRRSRSGSTFQSVIYEIYNLLGYPFDSQKKAGRTIFTSMGLGKIVDSVLPGVEEFSQRRGKTIIGSMKTSLRERWQEVSEEIARTNIPQIHLLTVDEDISEGKAKQMNEHNITLVVPKHVESSERLKDMKNIISFEEFLFAEIPSVLDYWKL